MVRDLSHEGFARFVRELDSQHALLMKGLINYPKENLIEKGFEYYSQLDIERQNKYDVLIRAHNKKTKEEKFTPQLIIDKSFILNAIY